MLMSAPCSFMCHPEMLLPIPDIDDPVERFVSVVKFYLSGWHIRPPLAYPSSLIPSPGFLSLTGESQRCQETPEPHTRGNIHMLLGPAGPEPSLLHIGADVAPPAQVELFLHGARTPYQGGRHAEAEEQVPRQLSCQSDGGNRNP